MNINQQPLQKKIAQLRASFISQLPARMDTIKSQVSMLVDDGCNNLTMLSDLHRAFHSLNGTGKSFGLFELSVIAAQAEALMMQLLDTPDELQREQWVTKLDVLMQALSIQVQAYAHAENEHQFAVEEVLEPEHTSVVVLKDSVPLIYICDDEPEQVDYLAHQLHCFGYEIQHFTETAAFRQAVLARRPDAVIMDVFFPQSRTAGTDELSHIKDATGQHLPAIVLSGSNSFESRLSAVRAGCSAYFTKPARPMDLAAALDELIEDGHQEPYQILIVDDEPEVAEYHSLILQNAGMVVHQIHNPTLIFEALKNFSPDLMLVDMYMPVCSGSELAALVRQVPAYVGLPIVFLSNETDVDKQFSAMQAGVEGFITKPVIPHQLVASVKLRAERMRTLRGLMAKDSLTGLYNHTTTTEMLVSALANAVRQQESLAVVMIDLDKFKNINDTYGHMAGDKVIVALARMLKHRLRNSDVIGRYGGEEFALVLRNITADAAEALVNELREDFSKIVFDSGQEQFHCNFSAGISMYPGHDHAEDLRMAADEALYQAKNQGRNQVVMSRPDYE
ncbi:MAG: diguanylate cyclase [Pseudomonas sp.]|nr:diguanylate cyclase [Pseudomonas sp.]